MGLSYKSRMVTVPGPNLSYFDFTLLSKNEKTFKFPHLTHVSRTMVFQYLSERSVVLYAALQSAYRRLSLRNAVLKAIFSLSPTAALRFSFLGESRSTIQLQ